MNNFRWSVDNTTVTSFFVDIFLDYSFASAHDVACAVMNMDPVDGGWFGDICSHTTEKYICQWEA